MIQTQMSEKLFNVQIDRLKMRFGKGAFDEEFVDLVAKEVLGMTGTAFGVLADFLIGTRPKHKAPLIIDFREGRLHYEKKHFNATVRAAAEAISDSTVSPDGLKKCLDSREAKTLYEAVEKERIRQREFSGEK